MPETPLRAPRSRVCDEYATRINNTAIPGAMSALWKSEGYPEKIGIDSEGMEPLVLWGLNLERRRRGGYNNTFYHSFKGFVKDIGRHYHEHTAELYFVRYIDVRGRLWTPPNGHTYNYDSEFVGGLRQFIPDSCEDWVELSNWESILMCR